MKRLGATGCPAPGARPAQDELGLRPRHGDVGEPSLLLDLGAGDRAPVGHQALLHADDSHVLPLEPLGGVDRRERHAVVGASPSLAASAAWPMNSTRLGTSAACS